MITALARYTVRAAAIRLSRPSQVLAFLNEVLLRDVHDETCSVAVLRLHKREDGWAIVTSCGGHPLPVISREGSEPEELGRPGTLLGVLARPVLHDAEIVLARGDACCCTPTASPKAAAEGLLRRGATEGIARATSGRRSMVTAS